MTFDIAVSLAPTLRRLLGAGGPDEWPANVAWPLHQTVNEFRHELGVGVEPVPTAGLGWAIPGLEEATMELSRLGVLRLRDDGFVAWWTVDEHEVYAMRRELMRCDPLTAQRYYLAARRWAALATTSAKNLRRARSSSNATSRSGMPVRRHDVAPVRR